MSDECRIMVFNDPDYVPDPDAEIVDTGDHIPALILNRIFPDVKLWVRFYNWTQVDSFTPGINGNEVYWAEPGGVVHMTVESPRMTGWGSPFDALGLKVGISAKLAKRLKEIVRIAAHFTDYKPVIKWFDTDESNEKYYDGINIIRRSFARKMGVPKHVKRGNFRSMGPDGTIKGDCIIIADALMSKTHGDVDIVAPRVNLKPELATMGWSFTTLNPHHPHNHAMFDVQSASWLREWLYPRKLIKDTFTEVVNTVLLGLQDGEWPAWMILPEDIAHVDDLLPVTGETASEAFNRQYMRWQMYGMKPESSASIMGMAANAFKSRLESKLQYRDHLNRWKPKMWLPLPHAVYGHIITHEVLILAGYTIPDGKENKLFYHKESASFSLPGEQFADTFEAHGTWDLDDSAKFFLRKTKDGHVVCVIVRSPNSDGEYSIHEVDTTDFPLYHQYGEMPVIDLDKAPARIEDVLANQIVTGLPVNTHVLPTSFTKDEADYSIAVQKLNPGIGYLANAMMAQYASVGKSPAVVLCTMGDAVDAVQQTPYKEAFEALTEFTDSMWAELARYGKADKYIARTRIPWSIAKELNTYDGYFSALFDHFRKETVRYGEESRAIAFRTRMQNPIEEIMEMEFAPSVMETAGFWVTTAEKKFKAVVEDIKGNDRKSKAMRSAANRDIINKMVNALNRLEVDECNTLVMAMYRYCVTPGTSSVNRYGRSDRCLFAPTDEGLISTMDMLLRALVSVGGAKYTL